MTELSIVIPAYNEQDNLPSLLDELLSLGKKLGWDFEVIVANDNSSDGTGKIIDGYAKKFPQVKAVHRSKGDNGMGAALKDASRKARGEVIVWLMADKADDLNAISKFKKKIGEGFDMVFGSRYMKGGSRGDLPVDKMLYGSTYTRLCRLIFGIPVHDITNAFRAFRKGVFDSIRLEGDDFSISPEFAIKAQLAGFRLGEVPVTYTDRRAGQPKFKLFSMGVKYCSLLKYRIFKPN